MNADIPDRMLLWQIVAYDNTLHLDRISLPKITNSHEVLVKVQASSINQLDVWMTGGYGHVLLNQCLKRYASKTTYSEFPVICGRDFVGVVLETGGRVKPEYSKGTSVMGIIAPYKNGTHAEYIVVDESCIIKKPESISPVDAVSFLFAGVTAWSALRVTCLCKFRPKSCRKFLLIGASGGVGTIALQLLKLWDAKVIATCSSNAVSLIENLNPDAIIDYTQPNFLDKVKQLGPYDIIFDCAGLPEADIPKYTDSLKSFCFGQFVSLLPPLLPNTDKYGVILGILKSVCDHIIHSFRHVPFYKLCSSSYAGYLPIRTALDDLTDFMKNNQLKPVIDSVFPFDKVDKAYERVRRGHVRGKVIVKHDYS